MNPPERRSAPGSSSGASTDMTTAGERARHLANLQAVRGELLERTAPASGAPFQRAEAKRRADSLGWAIEQLAQPANSDAQAGRSRD